MSASIRAVPASIRKKGFETLERLADLLVKGKKSDQPSSDFLECPVCSSTAIKIKFDGSVKCAVCAATGSLKRKNGGFAIDQGDEDSGGYFTERALDNHTQYLTDKKILFRNTKDIIKDIQAEYRKNDYTWVDQGHEGHGGHTEK